MSLIQNSLNGIMGSLTTAGVVTTTSGGTLSSVGTTTNAVQVGNSSGTLTSLGVGTNGQLLLGGTSANPSWVTPTAGTGLSVTANSTTHSYAISAPVSIANGGTNAITMTNTDGVVYYNGTSLLTTTVGTAGYYLTSNGSGSAPTFQLPFVPWNDVTSSTQQCVSNAFYVTDDTSTLVTYTLPASPAFGDIVRIAGKGSGGWKIVYGTGQSIHGGASSTTTSTGNLASASQFSSVELLYVGGNSFEVISSGGTLTYT
jgi:hypothetical protein